MRHSLGATILLFCSVQGSAEAAIISSDVVKYQVNSADFGGTPVSVYVNDLYLYSDNSDDIVLNVFNLDRTNAAQNTSSFFQSLTSSGWAPMNSGGIFDTPALRSADSFVAIGGFPQNTLRPEQAPGIISGTSVDPFFGSNNAAEPGANAGWYNGDPLNLNGAVGQVAKPDGSLGLGVLIGRFTSGTTDLDLSGSTLTVTWDTLGATGEQKWLTVGSGGGSGAVPEPSTAVVMGLLAIVGFAGNRRRRRQGSVA